MNVNDPAEPTAKVVALALVIAGAWLMVSVKFWLEDEITFVAVMVNVYVPPEPAAGVPLNTPAGDNVTPPGNVSVSENVGAG